MQEINRFTMAGGREESRTVKQWPGVIMFLSGGIRTRWTGGRVADSQIPELSAEVAGRGVQVASGV